MNGTLDRPLVGLFVCLALVGLPATATAEAGAVQVALEPGVANLAATREQRSSWGFFGGFSVALGVTELLAIGFHLDRKVLIDLAPETTVVAWGPSIIYEFDLQPVGPFIAAGLAGVLTTQSGQGAPYPELAPVVSGGLNARLPGGFLVGAVFRYYLLPGPDGEASLAAPGYSSINLRLGLYFEDF